MLRIDAIRWHINPKSLRFVYIAYVSHWLLHSCCTGASPAFLPPCCASLPAWLTAWVGGRVNWRTLISCKLRAPALLVGASVEDRREAQL